MNRLYCDHCGLEVKTLNIMAFGRMMTKTGKDYQGRLNNLTSNAIGEDAYITAAPSPNAIKGSMYGQVVTEEPPGAFRAAEVCDNCIAPWMNGVANVCSRSDP